MMTLSFDLVGARPVLLLTITRVDGVIEYITSASQDVTVSATTWTAHPGLVPGVLTQRNDGTTPTMGMQATLTSAGKLRFRSVDRGKYERADVLVQVVDADNPGTPDFIFQGKMLGTIQYGINNNASFDLISKFAIPRDILVSVYTLPCTYSFGDPLYCRIPTYPYELGRNLQDVQTSETIAIGDLRRVRFATAGTPEDYLNVYLEATGGGTTAGSAPTYSSTGTTADGSVTWVARNSYVRAVRISATDGIRTLTFDRDPDPRATSDNTWFHPMTILFTSGEYSGRRFKGANWNAVARSVQVYLPCPYAAVDDWAFIAPDCDKTYTMCNSKYANAANHGGYPFQLGAKAQAQTLALT